MKVVHYIGNRVPFETQTSSVVVKRADHTPQEAREEQGGWRSGAPGRRPLAGEREREASLLGMLVVFILVLGG